MAESRVRTRAALLATVTGVGTLAIATGLAGPVLADSPGVGPIFVDGQAQVVPEFADPNTWIRQQLWVETEFDTDGDGRLDRMHVDVTRPAQTEHGLKLPVIYETSPYHAGTASTESQYLWNVHHELGEAPPQRTSPPPIPHRADRTFVATSEVSTWVPRGFAVVHSDSPGTGLSQGCPIAPNTSYYHYYRSNGLVRNPGGWVGEDVDYLFDFISSGYPGRRAYCADTVRTGEMEKFQDRVSGDYNDFWAGRDYLNVVEHITAATLMAHAFNDWNVMPEHSVRILAALEAQGVPVQAYFHQGGHGGAPPLELRNRWFTRYLHGVQNGVEDAPKAWIVRNETGASQLTPYPRYPNPAASPVTLRPQLAGGLTSLALPDEGTQTLVDAGNGACNAGTLATQTSDHRLLYVTPALSAPLHISGTPEVRLRLASSKPAANLSVALVRLPWTGAAGCESSTRSNTSVVTRGWADPQNHASLTDGQPLVPGRFYDLTFSLQPDDQVIPAGFQLGLMVFATDHEFTIHPEPGTELTVDLAATSLALPVVGGPLAMPICAAAGATETVVVGAVDSGVPNRAMAGHCTIDDHILDTKPWPNHGQFVRHAALLRSAAFSDVGKR